MKIASGRIREKMMELEIFVPHNEREMLVYAELSEYLNNIYFG